MNKYLLSICIPTFNRSEKLDIQLNFLEGEMLANTQVIVIDNASTDDTEVILEKHKQKMKEYEYYINKENIGADGSIRKLLNLASGEYVLFLGDDLFQKGALNQIIGYIEKYKPSLVHINNSSICDNSINYYEEVTKDYVSKLIQNELSSFMFMSGNIYKRDCINKINQVVELKYSTTLLYSMCCLEYGNLLYIDMPYIIQDNDNVTWGRHRYEVWFESIPKIFDHFQEYSYTRKQINIMKNKNYGFFLFCCTRKMFSTIVYLIKTRMFCKIINISSIFYYFEFLVKRIFSKNKSVWRKK